MNAHAISDKEVLKEAKELLEELNSFVGEEYDSDSEIACAQSWSMISELIIRLEKYLEIWKITEDALASISGERTPEKFPETSYDLAARKLKDARVLLTTRPI